jgi:hypothetical protein
MLPVGHELCLQPLPLPVTYTVLFKFLPPEISHPKFTDSSSENQGLKQKEPRVITVLIPAWAS